MTRPAPRPFISAVVPLFNEEENLRPLHQRLTKVLLKIGKPYEIVLVDDGSSDRSFEIMRELAGHDPCVRGIGLSRNFGHQTALTAGLDASRGEVVVMMDADLQDPPELLPRMLRKYEQGYDMVYAVRSTREGETWFKKLTASVFYRLLYSMTQIDIPLDTGDFRLVSRNVLDGLSQVRERNRFLRGLFSWVGYRSAGVKYKRAARERGVTKYPVRKMIRFALDGITSFSTTPLQIAMWLGFASAGFGLLYGLRVLWVWMKMQTVPGWASLSVLILFFGGVQLITLGILGEYIGRIFEEVKQRPLYLVREELGTKGERG